MKLAPIALGLLASLAGSVPGEAQIVGTTSLITIPVADMPPDGTITVGGGFVDKRYSEYLDGKVDYTPFYLSVEFLPFVELALRFSRPLNLDDRQRLGDRMVSARLRLFSETPRRPAIVFGAHDFLTVKDSNYFHAFYVVGSKHFQALIPVGLHLGYGSNVVDALAYQFVGVFGGISLSVVEHGELLVEYDADRFSAGVRYELLDRFRVLLALQGLNSVVAGASFNLHL